MWVWWPERVERYTMKNVHKSSMSMKLASNNVSGNQKYTCTHTKTMYDVFAHSSLPTSASLALGFLKKKERRKMMNNFAWVVIMLLGYLALPKRILAVVKVATNADTTVENAYTVKSAWKCETAIKNWRFLPLRRCFSRWGTFSVDPGILVSLYARTHHPYTTGEWMIFWHSEDSPVEVGPTKCSCRLEIQLSPHVRLLPATLQLSFDDIDISL